MAEKVKSRVLLYCCFVISLRIGPSTQPYVVPTVTIGGNPVGNRLYAIDVPRPVGFCLGLTINLVEHPQKQSGRDNPQKFEFAAPVPHLCRHASAMGRLHHGGHGWTV